jgi:hypothetical protein
VCKYRLYETNRLIKIINLVNSKQRIPKIKYPLIAIDQLNTIYNTNIEKLPLDKSNLYSKACLAGFTDSGGQFKISLEVNYRLNEPTSDKRGRVKCMFSRKQRVIDKPTGDSCVPFMT